MVPHGSTFLKLLEYVRITGDKVLEYLHAPVTSSPRDDSTGQAPCRFHAVHQKNQKRKRFDCCSKVLEYFRSESNLKVQICRLLSKHTSHIDPCRSIWHRQIQIGLQASHDLTPLQRVKLGRFGSTWFGCEIRFVQNFFQPRPRTKASTASLACQISANGD